MQLIKRINDNYYFCIDVAGLPFSESRDYATEKEASEAALNNCIEWESADDTDRKLIIENQIRHFMNSTDKLQDEYRKITGRLYTWFR